MSCQIRRLINQGRDQPSPLTDGKMEAGRLWRHFLSSFVTSCSAVNRKQNKTERDSVACGKARRVCKDSQRMCLHAGFHWSSSTTSYWEENRLLHWRCCWQCCVYVQNRSLELNAFCLAFISFICKVNSLQHVILFFYVCAHCHNFLWEKVSWLFSYLSLLLSFFLSWCQFINLRDSTWPI